jgi:adenosylhomocysteine nucleosidase
VIGVLAAMPSELKPFTRRNKRSDVVTGVTGIGITRATKVAEAMLRSNTLDRLIMIGVAGGLKGTSIGDVIVPETVIDYKTGKAVHPEPLGNHRAVGTLMTTDGLFDDPELFAAFEADGVVALDMETAAVGAVCEAYNVPWSVFRAISDRPSDGLVDHAVFKLAKPDGTPDFGAVTRYVLPRPWKVPGLLKLGRDLNRATRAAADAAIAAINAPSENHTGQRPPVTGSD